MTELNSDAGDRSSRTRTPSESTGSEASSSAPLRPGTSTEARGNPTHQAAKRSIIPSFLRDPEDTPDGRFKEHITYENVSSYPLGYPSWAAYQNSDPTFRIYKRFGTLRNRVLLYRQQELAKLEERLNELDEEDDQDPTRNHRIRSLRRDQADTESTRMAIINEIDAKLKHYDDLLERELRSGNLQKPTKRNYRSLVNYLWNRAPIVRSEMTFLKHRDDFVMLTEQCESPLERTLDHLICSVPFAWFKRLFSSEAQRNKIDKTKDSHTTLTSTERVEQLARFIASILAILLIGIPLYVLASGCFTDKTKITTLLVALVFFPVAIQIAARPKNHDLFTATAAYCAVLSAFLAASTNFNFGQSQYQPVGNGTLWRV